MTFEYEDYTNKFLLAMPMLDGTFFERKLILIFEHQDQGTFGLIVNQPLEKPQLQDFVVVANESIHTEAIESRIFWGGPVDSNKGFILHHGRSEWESTIHIKNSDISLTTSPDLLTKIIKGECLEKHLIAVGYSGWDKDQLEAEIKEGAWWPLPANSPLVFDVPHAQRWAIAAEQIGFNATNIVNEQGLA